MNEKRKTIGGEDILTSMQALGFDNYAGVMKVYLSKFRVVSRAPPASMILATTQRVPVASSKPGETRRRWRGGQRRRRTTSNRTWTEKEAQRGQKEKEGIGRGSRMSSKMLAWCCILYFGYAWIVNDRIKRAFGTLGTRRNATN